MSKAGSGKSSKGGGSKAKGGSVGQTVHRQKALQTAGISEHLLRLRAALHDDYGTGDRDCLADFAAFGKFDRNGLDLQLKFFTGTTLPQPIRRQCFRLAKASMEDIYDSCGYGWDDEEYNDAMREPEGRMLVAYEKGSEKPCGFIDFRFTVQGELVNVMEGFPSLLVEDLVLAPHIQRKGVGKHLLLLMELMARKYKMDFLSVKNFKNNPVATAFIKARGGFEVSYEFVPSDEPVAVWEKCFNPACLSAPESKESEQDEQAVVATPEKAGRPEQVASPPDSPLLECSSCNCGVPKDGYSKKQLTKKTARRCKGCIQTALTAPSSPPPAASKPEQNAAVSSALGAQFAAAMMAVAPEPAAAAAAAAPEPAASGKTDPLEVLSAFYGRVDPSKTADEIVAIIAKREAKSAKAQGDWFGRLCSALQEKYGEAPLAVWAEEMAARRASEAVEAAAAKEAGEEEAADEVDEVLEGLMDMFRENNGRDPTDEEVEQWMVTIAEAQAEAAGERIGAPMGAPLSPANYVD